MRKKWMFVMAVTVVSAFLLTGCCDHEWTEATCGSPKTCVKCGETDGTPTGEHKWIEATCTEPKTCSVCGATEGEAAGHKWEEATCTEPKTCSVCGETEGKALGHKWEEATCTEPKICSVCGETVGEALGHTIDIFEVTKEATCSEEGIETGKCSVCGKTVENKIAKKDHTPGEWQVTKEATSSQAGEQTRYCTVCGAVLDTQEYSLSKEEIEAQFKASCQAYSYEQIARDPDTYYLLPAVYTGEVVQTMEGDDGWQLRVDITPVSYGYTDTIYVEIPASVMEGKSRILEDDIITIWGYNFKTISYKSVLGATITIPAVYVAYYEIVG